MFSPFSEHMGNRQLLGGRRGDPEGSGKDPVQCPGRLAGERKHKLFGAVLEELPFSEGPYDVAASACEEESHRSSSPCGPCACSHSPEEGRPFRTPRDSSTGGPQRPCGPGHHTVQSSGLFGPSMGLSQAPDSGPQSLADCQDPLQW